MTIEKGKEWGRAIQTPTDYVEVASDRKLIDHWLLNREQLFVVRGGDLFRSLGAPLCDMSVATKQLLTVDVMRVEIDYDDASTGTLYALSNLQIGSWRSRCRFICVSNCGFIDERNIAPRAHPNDGEIEVMTVSPTIDWKQRFQAWRRTRTGTHLPHPNISMERGNYGSWTRAGNEVLSIDGAPLSCSGGVNWQKICVHVEPDACYVLV